MLFDKKELAGDLVYRRLNEDSIELKNFRIDESYHNQYWGKVLLTQLKLIAKENKIVTDVSEQNHLALNFFLRNGFQITGKESLYKKDQKEYLLSF